MQKFSDLINEGYRSDAYAAVVIDNQDNTNKTIVIVDKRTLKPKRTNELKMFDDKFHFTAEFKNYANRYFAGINGFLKSSMFEDNLEIALLKLKKLKRVKGEGVTDEQAV